MTHLADLPAHELSRRVAAREASCVEVVTAHLDRLDERNPVLNAVVARRPREEVLAEARAKDDLLVRGEPQGWLHGLPVAVTDLADAAGLPTSRGLLPDAPSAVADSLVAARLRAAGAIVVGKTNTPELGLGSHTYNRVHGTTLNPWDTTRSAGGSSGGAAVAVAARMLPVADGSDFFGSLRNPTGWTGTLGLRPSYGAVPHVEGEAFVSHGGTEGPIARDPHDLRLLHRTLAGYDARDPLALGGLDRLDHQWPLDHQGRLDQRGHGLDHQGPLDHRGPLDRRGPDRGVVGWLGDLDGYLPVEPEVLATCEAALGRFGDVGLEVEPASLPAHGTFGGTDDLWPTWRVFRHWLAGSAIGPLLDDPATRDLLKPEAVFEVAGLRDGVDGHGPISGTDVFAMSQRRTDLYRGLLGLFDRVDLLVLPTAQCAPFDATWTWPREVAGRPMTSYHRWMEVAAVATLAGLPALAMPAGPDGAGLPVGLQVIGPPRADERLLDLAERWERATGLLTRQPPPL